MISCDRIDDIDLLFCGIISLVYLMDLLITYSYIPHCKGCIFKVDLKLVTYLFIKRSDTYISPKETTH